MTTKRTIRHVSKFAAALAAVAGITVAAQPAAATNAEISAETVTDGYTHQYTWSFPNDTIPAQWSVYNSTGSNGSDSRDPNNVWASGGQLHLRASGTDGSGICLCRGSGKPSQAYGRWDIYARVPVDAHHDFAILLWPNDGAPKAGAEIDVAEFPGPNKTVLQNTVHDGPGDNKHTHFTNGTYSGWHKYSVVWSPNSLTFWCDDTKVWSADPSWSPYDPMHLVIQGGIYSSTTATTGSSVMDIKSIRHFR